MKSNKPSRNLGFTLVELLVVIAIIAVLVALGVGGIFKYRKSADKTGAIANIRSLQTTNALWAADHNGKFIPIYTFDGDKNQTSDWYRNSEFLSLLTGVKNPDTWKHPESILDPKVVRAKGKYYYNLGASYGYVSSNMPGGGWAQPNSDPSFRQSQLTNPERSAAFINSTAAFTKYRNRFVWKVGETKEGHNDNGMVAYRHDGKAVVVYYDGHVDMLSPEDIRKIDEKGGEEGHPFWNGGLQ